MRSSPFSRFNPQFNREPLEHYLKSNGIGYVFLGKELGARSDDRSCYDHGRVQYSRLAQTALFQSGIDRVQQGAAKYRVALMAMERLLKMTGVPDEDMFLSKEELLAKALARQEEQVAYVKEAQEPIALREDRG